MLKRKSENESPGSDPVKRRKLDDMLKGHEKKPWVGVINELKSHVGDDLLEKVVKQFLQLDPKPAYSAVAEPIVDLGEPLSMAKVSFTTPRTKAEIRGFAKAFQVINEKKSWNVSIPYDDIERMCVFPAADKKNQQVVLSMKIPVSSQGVGKKDFNQLVFLAPSGEVEKLRPHCVASGVSWHGIQAGFAWEKGVPAVYKASEGNLFALEKGVVVFSKPVIVISKDKVTGFAFDGEQQGRYTAVRVEMSVGKPLEFDMIEQQFAVHLQAAFEELSTIIKTGTDGAEAGPGDDDEYASSDDEDFATDGSSTDYTSSSDGLLSDEMSEDMGDRGDPMVLSGEENHIIGSGSDSGSDESGETETESD